MEKFEFSKQPKHEETPLRLRALVELSLKPLLGKIEISGKDHLQEIPKDKKIILAVSHISDIDMLVAIKAFGKDFKMKIARASDQKDFSNDSSGAAAWMLAGKDNFLPVDYKNKQGGPSVLNPENYEVMAESLRDGSNVLIAAHNPSYGALPKGGRGVAYLSQLGNGEFVVLPIAVNIKSEQPYRGGKGMELKMMKEKPKTDVLIGKPMELHHIEDIEEYKNLMEKINKRTHLTEEEEKKFKQLDKSIQGQSDEIMRSIAKMLPEEKQGLYKTYPL